MRWLRKGEKKKQHGRKDDGVFERRKKGVGVEGWMRGLEDVTVLTPQAFVERRSLWVATASVGFLA